MLIRITAMAVCLWYSFCIIGFNVHSCKNTHSSFLVSLVGPTGSCNEIHPDLACNPDAEDHCHDNLALNAEGLCWTSSSCCSDQYQSLTTASTDVQEIIWRYQDIQSHHSLAILASAIQSVPSSSRVYPHPTDPFRSSCCAGQLLTRYCIFRI